MIQTARLLLRAPMVEDLDPLNEIFGDAEVMRYVAWGRPFTREETTALLARMIARFEADGFGQLIAVRGGEVLGRVGLLPLNPYTWVSGSRAELGAEAELELGWTFARRAWGQGYALESARAVRDWATAHGERRLVSVIQVGNERSARLAEKLGAKRERRIVTSFGKDAHLYAYALSTAIS